MPLKPLVEGVPSATQELYAKKHQMGGMCASFACHFLRQRLDKKLIDQGTYTTEENLSHIAAQHARYTHDKNFDLAGAHGVRMAFHAALKGHEYEADGGGQLWSYEPTPAAAATRLTAQPAAAASTETGNAISGPSTPGSSRPSSAQVSRSSSPVPQIDGYREPSEKSYLAFAKKVEKLKHWYVSCEFPGKIRHAFALDFTSEDSWQLADVGSGIFAATDMTIAEVIRTHINLLSTELGPCVTWEVRGVQLANDGGYDSDDDSTFYPGYRPEPD